MRAQVYSSANVLEPMFLLRASLSASRKIAKSNEGKKRTLTSLPSGMAMRLDALPSQRGGM
jgi:hypothetical protein